MKERGFTHILIQESMEEGVYQSVLSMDAEPGDNLPLSTQITLIVCMNEAGQEGDSDLLVSVPDVRNMTKEEAQKLLEDAGLTVDSGVR